MSYQKSESTTDVFTPDKYPAAFQVPGMSTQDYMGQWQGYLGNVGGEFGRMGPEAYGDYITNLSMQAGAAGQGLFQQAGQSAEQFFRSLAPEIANQTFGGMSGQNALYSGAAQSAFGKGLGLAYQQTMQPVEMAAAQAGLGLTGQGLGLYGQRMGQMGSLYGQLLSPYSWETLWQQPTIVSGQNQTGFSIL